MFDPSAMDSIEDGPFHRFSDWPVRDLPVGPGIYTVWKEDLFIYVGIAGRSTPALDHPPFQSLRSRLGSHASGRRSGDQFCIYVCDRLVLPELEGRLREVADGRLSLDALTKSYIHANLGFRFAPVRDYLTALALEAAVKSAGLGKAGRPLLNPGNKPD